jgi:hypothetical protein
MLWPLDCFVARAPRNDGWVAADPIASVVVGRRLTAKAGANVAAAGHDADLDALYRRLEIV